MILVARTATALEEIEERIHQSGGSATIAPLDLTEGESIGKLAGAFAERWKKLDVLVLNAAMLGSLTPVQDIDPKEYSRLLSINLLANQALIAAFDPLLKRAEKADIVALTSSVGMRAASFLGRLWLLKGCARVPARRLCGRNRIYRPNPSPHRRPGRHPHPHARARLSRRGAGKRQAAIGRSLQRYSSV